VLRIKTVFQNISLINVHAPTAEKVELETKAFHQRVEDIWGVPGGMCQTSGGCSLC